MVTLGLLAILAVIVAFSAVVGLIRGLHKSVIRAMTLVLAVVITFVVAGPVTTQIAQSIQLEGMTLGEMLLDAVSQMEMVGDIVNAAPLMQEAILVMPAFVLSLVVFPVVFLLLNFVSWIVFLFVNKPLRKLIFERKAENEAGTKTHNTAGKRLAGMGVGVVLGVLIFGVLMAPMFGLFSLLPEEAVVQETMDTMVEQEYLASADVDMIMDAYAVTDSTLVKVYGVMGNMGKNYINSVSKIEAEGQTAYLGDELGALLALVETAIEGGLPEALAADADPNALYVVLADKPFMDALMQDLFHSRLLRSAAPELMAIAMESVANSMNVPADKAAVYDLMMDDVAQAVQNADIDYAAIAAYEKYRTGTSGSGSVFAPKRLNVLLFDMTQAEYEAEMQKRAELEATIAAIFNKALAGDNLDFTEIVANIIVDQVMEQATENGQGIVNTFNADSVQGVLANVNSEDMDAASSALLGQLTDPEQFETDMPTVDNIVAAVRASVQNAIADDDKAGTTASTLASVVSDVAGAIAGATDENGNLDITKLDYEKIASAVTGLQNSDLKDVGASMLDVVIGGDLGDNSMISDVFSVVRDGYQNGEDVGGTIGTAGALIGMSAAMQDGGDENAVGDSLVSLINNLNDFTIGLLPSIISEDTITSMGIPQEFAGAAYDVIETLLKELMKLKGAANYENEVNSILALYNLATAGVDQFGDSDIADLAGYAIDSDAIFNTLKSISTSNPFGIDIPQGSDRAELVEAIEDNYAQSGRTQRERDTYNAIATLLGLDEDVNLA